tara:strand:+ start:324 stop:464 length:141 start_codon:yes stop_codon:yes gene_type:complete
MAVAMVGMPLAPLGKASGNQEFIEQMHLPSKKEAPTDRTDVSWRKK